MSNLDEIWQAEINGEIYETTFGELAGWISENSLVESDKVRKGELRWLEAGRVPALVPFFNAKEQGEEIPGISVSTTVAVDQPVTETEEASKTADVHGIWSNDSSADSAAPFEESAEEGGLNSPDHPAEMPSTDFCSIHSDRKPSFICTACAHPFCKECPERFGSTVLLCPYCGAMCKAVEEVVESRQTEQRISADISAGFGFDDFGKALAFPFKHKASLFFGGLLFAFFSLGQGAASMGSMFLVAAALICFMMANALTFGVLANTVENFSKGVIDRNFMPNFDDFSLWDDVVHPFFLSIAVYISSFGLLILLVVGAVWYAWNSFAGAMTPQPDPAMEMLTDESEQTSIHLKELIEKAKAQNAGRTDIEVGEDGLTDLQRSSLDEEAEFQRLNDMATNYKRGQLESVVGKSPERQEEEFRAMAYKFFQFAGVFVLLAGVALLWGLFYFPAACAVAGYTRSFVATINPLVGLDTIRHMGFDYAKILVMLFLLSILSGIISAFLGMIFSPFDLPTFGNLPAKFIGSFATFYFSVVLAVILGFALYKNSEKLKLYRG